MRGLLRSRVSSLLLAAGLSIPAASAQPPELQVVGVQFWTLNESTRVAIEVSDGFQFYTERISNPDRVFFDVAGSRMAIRGAGSVGVHIVRVGDPRLRQIRVAQPQNGTTRIVLDLAGEQIQFRAARLSNPERLMVELYDPSKPVPEVTPSVTVIRRFVEPVRKQTWPPRLLPPPPPPEIAMVAPAAPAPLMLMPRVARYRAPVQSARSQPGTGAKIAVPVVTPASIPPTSMPAAAMPPVLAKSEPRLDPRFEPPPNGRLALPDTAGSVPATAIPNRTTGAGKGKSATGQAEQTLTRVLGLKLNRVVIDAGHGGKDSGTIGVTGLFEKDIVLDLALRVGAIIERKLGAEVIYTRSDDTFIPLEMRPQIANEQRADLFLSIHANSSPAESVSGVETYFLSMNSSNRAAEEVAARENAVSGSTIFELQDLVRKIALNDKVKESSEFAARIQTAMYGGLQAAGKSRNRGVRRAPFAVLIGARMPAVLVEVGFVSNPAEEARLRKPEHRQKIAEAMFDGIRKYADSLSHPAPELMTRQSTRGASTAASVQE